MNSVNLFVIEKYENSITKINCDKFNLFFCREDQRQPLMKNDTVRKEIN